MSKTLKQIADEIGVDKQRVYRYVKANHIGEIQQETPQNNGIKYYDEEAESQIKQGFINNVVKAHQNDSEALHEAHQIDAEAHQNDSEALHEAHQIDIEAHRNDNEALHEAHQIDTEAHQNGSKALHEAHQIDAEAHRNDSEALHEAHQIDTEAHRNGSKALHEAHQIDAEAHQNDSEALHEAHQIDAEAHQNGSEALQNRISEMALEALQKELDAKNKELDAKNEQIALLLHQTEQLTLALQNTTDSLKAAQALHAGTIRQQLIADADEADEEQGREKAVGFFARLFRKK